MTISRTIILVVALTEYSIINGLNIFELGILKVVSLSTGLNEMLVAVCPVVKSGITYLTSKAAGKKLIILFTETLNLLFKEPYKEKLSTCETS